MQPKPYALGVFNSVALDGGVGTVAQIAQWATGWRRSWNLYVGCKRGILRFYPTGGYNLSDLKAVFYEWLGFNVKEMTDGLVSWSGIIYDLDFCYKGTIRRRTLSRLANYTKAVYLDDNEVYGETSAYSDAASIAWYGRKEETIEMNGYSATAAATRAQRLLKFGARPYPRPIDMRGGAESYVDVAILGYAATGNWRYLTAADDSTDNADDWITEIVTTDCELISEGIIDTNTVQVKQTCEVSTRALDKMLEIAEMGGPSYEPWHVYVDASRKLHYRAVSLARKYDYDNGQLFHVSGEKVNPWTIEPGVVRDVNYPVGVGASGDPLLSDQRDALIEEVEVSDNGNITLRGEDFDEMAILSVQQDYEKMLADEIEEENE